MSTTRDLSTVPLSPDLSQQFDVAIVGAGFAGIACAIALVRCDPALNIALLDRATALPAGLPFAGARAEHLLNVRADQMALDSTQPLHFCDFLVKHNLGKNFGKNCGDSSAAVREVFAPRALYCEYLRERFIQAQQDAAAAQGQITHISVQVTQIAPSAAQYLISGAPFATGEMVQVRAAQLILALGAGNYQAPIVHPRWHLGPWRLTGLPAHNASDTALIIGSGLSGVDSAQTLHALGWRGGVHMLSPNARLPAAHARSAVPRWTLAPHFVQQSQSPRLFLRTLRAELALASAEGIDWRAVINALRPITTTIFAHWTPRQRVSILKRASSLWLLHRHRMPNSVAELINSLELSGQLARIRGRFLDVQASSAKRLRVRVGVRENTSAEITENVLDYALVIDARGPNFRCQDWPLIATLIKDGLLTPSPTGFGLLADMDGRVGKQIYTLGVLAYGERLETASVPEIRQQAERIAELIVGTIGI